MGPIDYRSLEKPLPGGRGSITDRPLPNRDRLASPLWGASKGAVFHCYSWTAGVAILAMLSWQALAQSTAATFGDVVRLGYIPADVILDESRSVLYLVNQSAGRID